MFENPREAGKQELFVNKCSENARSQIVFRTEIFRELSLGDPKKRFMPERYPSDKINYTSPEYVWPIPSEIFVRMFLC